MENKLGLFGIIKESVSIPFKNPYFIIFTFLTSLPSFTFSIFHESLFQQTLIETAKNIQHYAVSDDRFSIDFDLLQVIVELMKETSHKFLLLGLLYLGILHFLYLFSIIATVQIASMVYQGESKNFTDLFKRLIKKTKSKGPLITSIQVLLLEALISIGLVSSGPCMYIPMAYICMIVFSLVSIALFIKYLEWSAVWDLSIVISVLDEKKYGDVALVISSFLTRDSRKVGLILAMFFFALRVVLRLWSFYLVGWNIGASRVFITAVQVGFVSIANVFKWVTFVIYFYDCEKQSSRKAVEEGRTEEQLLN